MFRVIVALSTSCIISILVVLFFALIFLVFYYRNHLSITLPLGFQNFFLKSMKKTFYAVEVGGGEKRTKEEEGRGGGYSFEVFFTYGK